MVHCARVHIEKISQAARKTPDDVSGRDGMPPVCHSLGDAKPGQLDTRKSEVDQFHAPARRAKAPNEALISAPGQRGFEGEVSAFDNVMLNLLQEQPAGGDRLLLGGQRR